MNSWAKYGQPRQNLNDDDVWFVKLWSERICIGLITRMTNVE